MNRKYVWLCTIVIVVGDVLSFSLPVSANRGDTGADGSPVTSTAYSPQEYAANDLNLAHSLDGEVLAMLRVAALNKARLSDQYAFALAQRQQRSHWLPRISWDNGIRERAGYSAIEDIEVDHYETPSWIWPHADRGERTLEYSMSVSLQWDLPETRFASGQWAILREHQRLLDMQVELLQRLYDAWRMWHEASAKLSRSKDTKQALKTESNELDLYTRMKLQQTIAADELDALTGGLFHTFASGMN